ncbi:MAG: hypothetical protein K5945_05840 [Bacteroidaceae bacterium]|nr:hypothetical protein [Bacteroidaceae bacterium]
MKEIALRLGVSRNTLYRFCHEEELGITHHSGAENNK